MHAIDHGWMLQHMPEDMEYDADSMLWRGKAGGDEVRVGSVVRLRVFNASVRIGQVSAVGTISDPHLGVVSSE